MTKPKGKKGDGMLLKGDIEALQTMTDKGVLDPKKAKEAVTNIMKEIYSWDMPEDLLEIWSGMTLEQRKFCAAFSTTRDKTVSFRAVYGEGYAQERSAISKVWNNKNVRSIIHWINQELAKTISPPAMMTELYEIALAKPSKSIKTSDKIKAIELLSKMVGTHSDQAQINIQLNIPVLDAKPEQLDEYAEVLEAELVEDLEEEDD